MQVLLREEVNELESFTFVLFKVIKLFYIKCYIYLLKVLELVGFDNL